MDRVLPKANLAMVLSIRTSKLHKVHQHEKQRPSKRNHRHYRKLQSILIRPHQQLLHQLIRSDRRYPPGSATADPGDFFI